MGWASQAQISRSTLALLLFVTLVFFAWNLVVVCTGLKIHPFRETTAAFLLAGFICLPFDRKICGGKFAS